jgi:hypothetical protein
MPTLEYSTTDEDSNIRTTTSIVDGTIDSEIYILEIGGQDERWWKRATSVTTEPDTGDSFRPDDATHRHCELIDRIISGEFQTISLEVPCSYPDDNPPVGFRIENIPVHVEQYGFGKYSPAVPLYELDPDYRQEILQAMVKECAECQLRLKPVYLDAFSHMTAGVRRTLDTQFLELLYERQGGELAHEYASLLEVSEPNLESVIQRIVSYDVYKSLDQYIWNEELISPVDTIATAVSQADFDPEGSDRFMRAVVWPLYTEELTRYLQSAREMADDTDDSNSHVRGWRLPGSHITRTTAVCDWLQTSPAGVQFSRAHLCSIVKLACAGCQSEGLFRRQAIALLLGEYTELCDRSDKMAVITRYQDSIRDTLTDQLTEDTCGDRTRGTVDGKEEVARVEKAIDSLESLDVDSQM